MQARKNGLKSRMVILAATLAISSMMAMPVMADTFTYTPINGPASTAADVFKFDKDFTMKKDATIPEANFNYSIAPGTAIAATSANAGVLAGPTGAKVVGTSDGVIHYDTADASATVTVDGNNKTATKQAAVDLSAVSFTEPGVYRYIITESGTNNGVTNDAVLTRTLDVYVVSEDAQAAVTEAWIYDGREYATEDEAKAAVDVDWPGGNDYNRITHREAQAAKAAGLAIDGYVFYSGTKTDAPSKTAAEATGKSEGYENTYDSYDLKFGKEVKGNFGSLDEYFPFTVEIDAAAGTVLQVDLSDADATPHASDATTAAGKTTAANPTTLTASTVYVYDGEDFPTQQAAIDAAVADGATADDVTSKGKISHVFWLHDGQYVTIKDLPANAAYSVTEDAGDYTSANGVAAADNDEGIAHTDPTSGTMTASVKTGYTNTRETVTPAGLAGDLTSMLPGLIAIGGGALGIGSYVGIKRKKKAKS